MTPEVTQKAVDLVVSVTDLRRELRVEGDDETLNDLICDATDWIEQRTGLRLGSQMVTEHHDDFPCGVLELHSFPVQSVVVKYDDTNGAEQTFDAASYAARLSVRPAKLSPDTSWPAVEDWPGAVRVEMTCGYDPADVPSSIKKAIKLLCGHWYENREATISGTIITDIPIGVQSLIQPYVGRLYS